MEHFHSWSEKEILIFERFKKALIEKCLGTKLKFNIVDGADFGQESDSVSKLSQNCSEEHQS